MKQEVTAKKIFIRTYGWRMAWMLQDYNEVPQRAFSVRGAA